MSHEPYGAKESMTNHAFLRGEPNDKFSILNDTETVELS